MVTKIILQTLESITKQLSLFLRARYAAGTVLRALYTFSHFDSDNFIIPVLILIIVVLSLGHDIITIILQMGKLRQTVVSKYLVQWQAAKKCQGCVGTAIGPFQSPRPSTSNHTIILPCSPSLSELYEAFTEQFSTHRRASILITDNVAV